MTSRKIIGLFLIILGFILLGYGLINRFRNVGDNKNITNIDSITPTIRTAQIPLDEIFRYHDPIEATKSGNSKPDEYSIIVTGDVIPARSVNSIMVRKNNFLYPWEKTAEILQSSDLLFINLETPLLPVCKITDEGMKFCGNAQAIEGLKYAGVKVVSLANNHAGNYGQVGLQKTRELLGKNGIQTVGMEKPAVIQIKDKKFGFLGYNDIEKQEGLGMSLASESNIASEVSKLKKETDFTIVTFHWGIEYTASPSARQKELAHIAIDNGADLVVGNHPHWVQGVEIYKNKLITYAHGNFIFDQMWSQETREGVVGKYVFDRFGLKDVSFYPVIIENYSQPRFANEKEAEKILKRMKNNTYY